MNVPRRQITQGVYDVFNSVVLPKWLSDTATWKSISKDAEIWTSVDPFDQPYCGIISPEDNASDPQAFGLTVWRRRYYGLIYFRRDAVSPPPGFAFQDVIDDLLDGLDAAFTGPRKGEQNTLGGIVQDCMIDGTIGVDPGTLDQQCAIVVPITIITGI